MALDREWLINKYHYDKDTGLFTSRDNGRILGRVDMYGYIRTSIKGKYYRLHRLAWLYVYDELPSSLDHIDRDKSNNRISNLRETNHAKNNKNKNKYKTNTSGVTGVCYRKDMNRWGASINVDKTKIHLGIFASYSDAVDARKNAEAFYGFYK